METHISNRQTLSHYDVRKVLEIITPNPDSATPYKHAERMDKFLTTAYDIKEGEFRPARMKQTRQHFGYVRPSQGQSHVTPS